MQAGVGLLVSDVMPIYMIMPRYSHNYALFYQLLDNNLFTHCNNYAILREATSKTYGPQVYLLSNALWYNLAQPPSVGLAAPVERLLQQLRTGAPV